MGLVMDFIMSGTEPDAGIVNFYQEKVQFEFYSLHSNVLTE
jgi:hypothetical protein